MGAADRRQVVIDHLTVTDHGEPVIRDAGKGSTIRPDLDAPVRILPHVDIPVNELPVRRRTASAQNRRSARG